MHDWPASVQTAGISACLVSVVLAGASPGISGVYVRHGDVFHHTQHHVLQHDECLVEAARRFDLGFNEITAANSGIDPYLPTTGIVAVIPSTSIIPDSSLQRGMVINRAEMRLYLLGDNRNAVASFPVGVGDLATETPLGRFRIIEKITSPSWYVPRSIMAAHQDLSTPVPPGPDNPLGSHALRLSQSSILIHGTNRPFSIGRRASHGCIRLYPEDITRLFSLVQVGTNVEIVDQPIKAIVWGERVYVEVHAGPGSIVLEQANQLLLKKGLYGRINRTKLIRALAENSGIPVDITKR